MKQSSVLNEYKSVCQRSRTFFSTARVIFLSLAGNTIGFFLRGMCGQTSRKLRGNMHGRGCRLINKCLALSYCNLAIMFNPWDTKEKINKKKNIALNSTPICRTSSIVPFESLLGAGESKCYRFN